MRSFIFNFDSCGCSNYHPGTDMRVQIGLPMYPAIAKKTLHAGAWMVLLTLCLPPMRAKTIPHPHHQPKQIVHKIEALEQQWQLAELHSNTTVMASMLADDYLGIYGDGTLATKAETLADAKNGTVRFTRIDTSDRKIRVFGTTVVVISKAEVAGVIDDEPIDGHYRYTRVYHRIDGVWKIVSFEASSIHRRKHPH